MSAQDKTFDAFSNFSLGSLTTTAANETARIPVVSGIFGSLLVKQKLSAMYPVNEVWIPVAVSWVVTTGITVTAAVVTLRKNGVTSTVGGTVTMPIQASGANFFTSPISDWTGGFASAPAPGDSWSLIVTTTSTAGVVNPVILWYATADVAAVTSGVLAF